MFFFHLQPDLAPTHVRRLLLQEPRTCITETWDRAPSLAHLYPLLQISANNTGSTN
jgi:hypothetical protein